MPIFAIVMLAASIIGFVIAAVITFSADKKLEFKEYFVLLGIIFIKVSLSVCAAFIVYERAFAVDVSMTMKTPCYILGFMFFICCIIQGAIIRKELENGRTENLAGKILIPEVLSIAGLVYFFMQNAIPL